MKVIYISSPYSIGDVGENVSRHIEAANIVMNMGHCPIAPLLTHFMHIVRPRPYEDWMACDLELVKRCDIVWRLPGESKGADRETAAAAAAGIAVVDSFAALQDLLWRIGVEVPT